MLQEKAMVNDALSGIKSSITFYATTITECQNQNLRSALAQIRNKDEASQYELFRLAQSKGYYKPAAMASDSEVGEVRTQLQG